MEVHKICVLCQWKRDKGQATITLVDSVQLVLVCTLLYALPANRDVFIVMLLIWV